MSGELITADGQLQIDTLLMGTGTIYRLSALTGWDDLPPLDLADVPRPAAAGYYPGTIYAAERAITADITIVTDPASYPAAVARLRAATIPAAEAPLAMQWGGQKLQAGVRCVGRIIPPDGYALGVARAALRWIASDPRRYTVALSSASTAPPATGAGITYPVTYPVTWPTGGAGATGTVNVVNSGDTDTPPVITIGSGPLTTPAVYRQDTGDVLELNTTLAASDTVVIDVLADTVTLNGAPAKNLLTDRSAPVSSFLMPPGTTGLAFRAAVTDPSALMTATWRSAYL